MSIAIVGAGAAGVSALAAARARGVEADLYQHRPGASRLTAGLWDLATDLSRPALEPRTVRDDLSRFVERRPDHPLARLADRDARVAEAQRALLAELDVFRPFELDDRAALAVTDLGLLRRTATVDRAVFDLSAFDGGIVAVLGFPFFRDHDAHFVAASLNELAAERSDLRFVAIDVDFLSRRTDAIMYPLEIAKLLDGRAARDRMVRDVTRAMAGHHLAGALFPPLLGVETDLAAFLRERLSIEVGEIATPLASVQAHRVARALRATSERLARARYDEEVIAIEPAAGSVLVRTKNAEREYGAAILATGKILTGGVVRTADGWIEPLTATAARATSVESVGVAFDGELLLCGGDGPRSPRLFAAGSILAGCDPRDGAGLGAAATTGWVAGCNAARAAVERQPLAAASTGD